MFLRNPRYIKERTLRYVPPPSVLVPVIQHVYNIFGNARDAESGQPLFNKTAWQKANAVLELAWEGYLSDPAGVVLYEKAGIDENGLQKWKCKRGTNKLEGGPHGDIYRKFGALHAAPRLTVNSLTDHRTHYNLQAMAKYVVGVDWDYHHNLAFLNHSSFLLNYLADIIDGADSYAEWMNADLYECSTEKFGVCAVPESLRIRLEMELYNDDTAQKFKLNANNDWLRRRQGSAIFFSKIGSFMAKASANGRRRINYVEFAKEWNRTADGKTCHYVTSKVLSAYAKTWEKTNNARASQELIEAQIDMAHQTTELFQTPTAPFPDSLKGVASSAQPQCGVVGFTDLDDYLMPSSLSVELATSHPRITPNLTVKQPNPNHRRDANSSHLSLQDCAPSKPHSHSGLAVQNSTLASTSTINPPGSRHTGPPNSPPPVPSSYDTHLNVNAPTIQAARNDTSSLVTSACKFVLLAVYYDSAGPLPGDIQLELEYLTNQGAKASRTAKVDEREPAESFRGLSTLEIDTCDGRDVPEGDQTRALQRSLIRGIGQAPLAEAELYTRHSRTNTVPAYSLGDDTMAGIINHAESSIKAHGKPTVQQFILARRGAQTVVKLHLPLTGFGVLCISAEICDIKHLFV
ncbi:hypothetical protein FB451DRAFT_1380474 [Mycena latifolia]|nr:hypothetical protein FB451DRAFT_1380474 [Mycena latifolia]